MESADQIKNKMIDKQTIQLAAQSFTINALRKYYQMPNLTDGQCIMLDEYNTFMNIYINGVEYGVSLKLDALSKCTGSAT